MNKNKKNIIVINQLECVKIKSIYGNKIKWVKILINYRILKKQLFIEKYKNLKNKSL